MLIVLSSCLLSPMMIIIQSYMICRDKYAKSLNYVLNQNVNVTKRERFATLAMRIVDNARGGGTSYDGLYGEAPCEKGMFFSLQVCERVGISLVEVYLTVIPRVQIGSESIVHEAEGRIGY